MPPTDPRSQAALDAALQKIRTTVQSVASRVCDGLVAAAQSTSRPGERDACNSALLELRRHGAAFLRVFAQVLREKIDDELAQREDSGKKLATATWQTLSLVGDDEMEERMFADRISQAISHACDAELRDLAPYMGSLLYSGRPGLERNPLRADMLGVPLYRAIEAVTRELSATKLLGREFSDEMAKAMPACYAEIVRDLQAQGIRPAVLTARSVEGPGGASGNSGYATLHGSRSHPGDLDSAATAFDSGHGFGSGSSNAGTRSGPGSAPGPSMLGGMTSRTGYGYRTGDTGDLAAGAQGGGGQADAQLMALLRRLSSVVGHSGHSGHSGHADANAHADAGGRAGRAPPTGFGSVGRPGPVGRNPPAFDSSVAAAFGRNTTASTFHPANTISGSSADGLMAVNLIRAHREELMQASSGQLDHMVIDVVGSLFDQILSDARVPPQMARQIARLQLPVLRVALSDPSFFSSRRHPVRRFVNRIASLACAFDDFDDGPGRQFIDRVRELVQEIVDGDFDQIDLYAAQLGELERFIAEQAEGDSRRNGTALTLATKENELRLQQRYLLQLQAALTPFALPAYLREFLTQVWSQALVLAAGHGGANSERSLRFRRAGRDLIMSVQPKGSPMMRKKFLMQLPPLMKDLNEGLRLVGWPEEAQREFFAKLLPAHSESLKAPPISELDHNMMGKRLEAVFNVPLPTAATLSPADGPPETGATVLPQRFTPEEARSVGLVEESAVDWSGTVDIDLGDELQASAMDANGAVETAGGQLIDVALDLGAGRVPDLGIDLGMDLGVGAGLDPSRPPAAGAAPAEAPEPTRGLALMEHVKLGFAYQMHLKDTWQKVRLTHVSAGRSFFVFSLGRKHQETISMTARMLARMCETGRMRAVESAYLIERATQRARKQLAALRMPARV